MAQTNDQGLAGVEDVTRKANRVQKQRKPKFVPFPEMNADGKSNRMPKPVQQQALHDLWMSMTSKDQAVVLKFINTAEFTSPGYGRSVRWLKRFSVAQPRQVNLK